VPIILTLTDPPGSDIGPGAPINFASDLTVGTGDVSTFNVLLRRDSAIGNIFYFYQLPYTANNHIHWLMTYPAINTATEITWPPPLSTVYVEIQQFINGAFAANVNAHSTWDNTKYLGDLIGNLKAQSLSVPATVHTIDDVWSLLHRVFPAQ
jgi:hypothetical protein